MIAAGLNGLKYSNETEVIELTADGSNQCQNWNEAINNYGAVGALLDNIPFIC